MGKKALRERKNWQTEAGVKATEAERNLYTAFEQYFENTEYVLHKKPKHFKKLYSEVALSKDVLNQIYNPPIDFEKIKWGNFSRFCY